MRSAIITALFMAASVAIGAEKTPLQQRQAQMRQAQEQSTRGYRILPTTYPIGDVCRLRWDGQTIRLSTPLASVVRNAGVRLTVEGMSGVNVLSINGNVDAQGTPEIFSFTNNNYTDPAAVQVSTQVSWHNGQLNIGRYVQLMDGYRNTRLFHGGYSDGIIVPGANQWRQVSFTVQAGDNRGGMQININHTAPDFLTLRRKYAADVDRHLRPILRDLKMESLLAADPLVAWQVFADELTVQSDVMEKVKSNLPGLDADSVHDQQVALQKLGEVGPFLVLAVRKLDRTKLSAQQNVLLDTAIAPYRVEAMSDAARLRGDVDFLVDCLFTDDANIRRIALQNLRRRTGREIDVQLSDDAAQRARQIDVIREQVARPTTAPAKP